MTKEFAGRELVATSDLSRWRAIVTISGDGLFHEVSFEASNRFENPDAYTGAEWYFRERRLDGRVQASTWCDTRWHWQRACKVIRLVGKASSTFPASPHTAFRAYNTHHCRTIQFENNESEEDCLVRQATLRAIRCTTTPMDLVCVQLSGGRFSFTNDGQNSTLVYFSIYSFLSAGWGFISDVDIESEKLRWMGDTR